MRVLFYFRNGESFAIELLSSLLKQAGHETGLLYDPGIVNNPYTTLPFSRQIGEIIKRRLVKQAQEFEPDLLAFSSSTFTYQHVHDMERTLKSATGAPSIIGGVHAWMLPEKTLEDGFNIVCVGEGEGAMLDLVNCMESGKSYQDIPNLWMKDENGNIRKNPVRPMIEDLDALPPLDKKLFFDQGAIFHRQEFSTSRDCPYNCSFCVNFAQNKTYEKKRKSTRRRSVDSAIEELLVHKELTNPWGGYFYDDIFVQDADWLDEFCDRYAEEIGVPFGCQVHPILVKPRICRALKKAGCYIADMGVQTGRETIRHDLNRSESNDLVRKACRTAHEEGLDLCLHWIFGLPRETPESMWETYEFARELNPRYHYTTLLTTWPGTKILDECLELGLVDDKTLERLQKGGHYSWHREFLLNHPHRDAAMHMKFLLPIFVKLPSAPGNAIFKKIYKKPFGFLSRFLGLVGIPLMDIKLAAARSLELAYSAWFQFGPRFGNRRYKSSS